MYSTEHSEYERSAGEFVDTFTLTDLTGGPFAGYGEIHFCSEEHLRELYEDGYDIERIEHKVRTEVLPDSGDTHAAWDVVAKKTGIA
jgi:hypothetical protein